MHSLVARSRKLVVAAVIVTAAAVALFVQPVFAGTMSSAAQAHYCNPLAPAGSEIFSLVGDFTTAHGRGDDAREPSLGQVAEDLPASAKGKAGRSFSATVPVYFHVVTDGATGAISNRVIRDQMRVLDLAFAGFYGGANTGFSFDLVSVDRTDNAAWFYAGPTTKEERDMKTALHRGGANALNLYSTTAGVYLGWAYLPSIVNIPGQAYLDGIVVDWESMPGASTRYAGRYDLGHTATHEAGHWFNLEHTFFGGCNRFGDFVDDTPAQLVPTSGCPADGTQDTCTRDPGFDPIHNYMDYSYDRCYFEFTPGQAQRERDSWLFYRAVE